ncbi:MAG: ABC transporter substrate-binding protein [Spirochaetaceae bacterium]|nr:MAG: ABC transporter substrate-binding protein [Spirochaetaceae bacterium]
MAAGSPEADQPEATKGPVVVASKIDTEGALLGNMIVHVLRADGFEVVDNTEFGPTDVIRRAITSDEIDIYPEYTGNGAFFFEHGDDTVWKDPQAAYETVARLDLEANDIVWLTRAPANNTWAIAVRNDIAEPNNLRTLEDLANYIRDGGQFKIAASEEFVSRDDVLPAFERTYDFSVADDQMLTFSTGNTATTIQAAARQTDGVNAAMAYGTDGPVAALGLRVMEDSLGVMPVYEPAPIVRRAVLQHYPEIETLLEPVFAALNMQTLQTLNARIAVEGQNAAVVAREWLEELGFLQP